MLNKMGFQALNCTPQCTSTKLFLCGILCPVWMYSSHNEFLNLQLNHTMRIITVSSTLTQWLPIISEIVPSHFRKINALLRKHKMMSENEELPNHQTVPSITTNRIKSIRPSLKEAEIK